MPPSSVEALRDLVEAYLAKLPFADELGALTEAMRYSLDGGGKRIRPVLCLATGEAVGAEPEELLPAAAAIELVHTFGMVHDDLPALDDDDLRRGRATSHVRFDEATAILNGDALLAQAFELALSYPTTAVAHELLARRDRHDRRPVRRRARRRRRPRAAALAEDGPALRGRDRKRPCGRGGARARAGALAELRVRVRPPLPGRGRRSRRRRARLRARAQTGEERWRDGRSKTGGHVALDEL